MSAGKDLILDLECAICLERFTEPKTLKCLHSYCLHCLEILVERHGQLRCPMCGQHHEVKKEDLKNLTCNEKIQYLLDYVEKIESEKKSSTCCSCYNQPTYHCSECLLYFCGKCSKHHKTIPALKNHQLYILERNEGGTDENYKCPTHCNNVLEFYCSTCNKSACEDCNQVLSCYQNKHDVIEMKTAVDNFNQNASEVIRRAEGIKINLKRTLESIHNDMSELESAVEVKQKRLIKIVQKKSKELLYKLEEIHKEKKKDVDLSVKDINSKLIKANDFIVHINTVKKFETYESYWHHLMTINDVAQEDDVGQAFHIRNIKPNLTISTQLDELINTERIGKNIITPTAFMYKVVEDEKAITVTNGQTFVVKVSGPPESDTCQLAATLRKSMGKKTATEIEYQGSGEYKITGRCNVEGDWQMKITAGAEQIKGSPVNIKVELQGLVHTIGDISKYTKGGLRATDVTIDTNGCILVSSKNEYILKFNRSAIFLAKIQVPKNANVKNMHLMGDGHMMYSCSNKNYVVMCNDKFQEICSFGKETLMLPGGIAVNNETRVLYVADWHDHCVFKFNVDNGNLLGKIGSEGSKEGQMEKPVDVTVTKEGHVIVADYGNKRIQIFDANDNLIRVVNQKFGCPSRVTTDMDGNIIVSSGNKLELLDKNGVFIKRIDRKGELRSPRGVCVISNRPRRVAVTNYTKDNVNIFNY